MPLASTTRVPLASTTGSACPGEAVRPGLEALAPSSASRPLGDTGSAIVAYIPTGRCRRLDVLVEVEDVVGSYRSFRDTRRAYVSAPYDFWASSESPRKLT